MLIIDDLSVEVKTKKINETLMFPEPKPFGKKDDKLVPLMSTRIYFDRTNGQDLGTTKQVGYRTEMQDNEGNVYEQIEWRIEENGALKPTAPYQRSKVLQGRMPMNVALIGDYKAAEVYEVFINSKKYNDAERRRMEASLFEKAKEWWDKDKAMLATWVHRDGSQPYAVILQPIIKQEDGEIRFVFKMITTRTKIHYDNMITVPTQLPQEVTILEEPETAQLLEIFAT